MTSWDPGAVSPVHKGWTGPDGDLLVPGLLRLLEALHVADDLLVGFVPTSLVAVPQLFLRLVLPALSTLTWSTPKCGTPSLSTETILGTLNLSHGFRK